MKIWAKVFEQEPTLLVEELDTICIEEGDQLCFIEGGDLREGIDQFLDTTNSFNILYAVDHGSLQRRYPDRPIIGGLQHPFCEF